MDKSIHQFLKEGTQNLDKVFGKYADDPTKIAEMVYGVTDEMVGLGCSLIAEEWESYDELLHRRPELRPGWVVERTGDARTVTTSLGDVTFHRTYYKNKNTGEYAYLVDKMLELDSHERMTEDAKARILEEAVDSSYRKGGENASIGGSIVSKEAVMDLIHPLRFPLAEPAAELKKVETLYIDADEDHVSLQFFEKKGDIPDPRANTYMPKLVYVYEDVEAENDRRHLVGARYFGGGYEGNKGQEGLWQEIETYIRTNYDEAALKKIYINGDGAGWIKAGVERLPHAKFVLDRYHMGRYIIAATAHLNDSKDDIRSEIYRCINGKHRKELEGIFSFILDVTESEPKKKAVEASRDYILGHWTGIMASVDGRKEGDNVQCSAEGHVSHVYSDRMSSRPLGWSRTGADKMARLRIYKYNRGSMLDLIRFQKQELPKAAGSEEAIFSAWDVLRDERRLARKNQTIYDTRSYTVPYTQIKKIAWFKGHIWGL